MQQRAVEYKHHGDDLVPRQQRFSQYTRSLMKSLAIPVMNEWGLRPAVVKGTRDPVPLTAFRDLDKKGLLSNVSTLCFHQHLPHYALTGNGGESVQVLARQRVDPDRPHPFTAAGNSEFNCLLWLPPAEQRAGDIFRCAFGIALAVFGEVAYPDARVALIGQTPLENRFDPGEEAIGATIRIKNVPFQVVGVLAPKGQSAQGSDQDDVIFIPFTTAERKVFGSQFLGSVGALFASTEQSADLPEAVDQIREVLRARHRLQGEQADDFTIRTQGDIGKVQESTSQTLTVMLFAIASVSLLVGGIGIMNILLVSVTERTREIGVRMAVGAKRLHILMQFLIEAVTLSLFGGVIGVIVGLSLIHISEPTRPY